MPFCRLPRSGVSTHTATTPSCTRQQTAAAALLLVQQMSPALLVMLAAPAAASQVLQQVPSSTKLVMSVCLVQMSQAGQGQ